MGWFKWFNKINPQKVFDTCASGIDKLAFTKEEKAELNENLIKAHSEFVINTLQENSIRSVTRRYIAFAIIGVVLFLTLLSAGIFVINKEYSLFLLELVKSYDFSFAAVVAFFFGSHMIRQIPTKKK